jgi:hypothetical protein
VKILREAEQKWNCLIAKKLDNAASDTGEKIKTFFLEVVINGRASVAKKQNFQTMKRCLIRF